jgi:hypothetical protein
MKENVLTPAAPAIGRSAVRIARAATGIAAGLACVVALLPAVTRAASDDGSLAGHLTTNDKKALQGTEVTVRNPETGFTREVKVDVDGYYRFPFLPVGTYSLVAHRGPTVLGQASDVAVLLGTTTTADVSIEVPTVEEVRVLGNRVYTAVDVKSTESATNISRDELSRLPVERDPTAVALLAPGLVKGDSSLATGNGISFGGSSIAENSFYINGLNVTDFYKRIGFSEVPYAFYKEFQIKTGGYSVEFGRTTGGVVNAVTRSGTNEFEAGAEIVWEPHALQSSGTSHFNRVGAPVFVNRYDNFDREDATVYGSGPIIKDKLFFFALYEARDYKKTNTDDVGQPIHHGKADNGFWGADIDWQINDSNLLQLLGFSDKDDNVTNTYDFDLAPGISGPYQNKDFDRSGGTSWAATYTAYLPLNLSMKALYGQNKHSASNYSLNDADCNRISDQRDDGLGDVGCTDTSSISARDDTRKAARLDFEWALGQHQVRFGLDHGKNTSVYSSFYPGPDRLVYQIYSVDPGSTLGNGAIVPDGVTAYVRTRESGVSGTFNTINSAYYLEDNWSVTNALVLNAGVRLEGFDNRDAQDRSYIKMNNMVAPRFGFSWDVTGDRRSKVFGNAGRYFLPVANVINIKQAGAFLDRRTYYAFGGLQDFQYNGQTYQRPLLGAQIGPVDDSQGNGTVGDLRSEVDADMDPVYQDEFILGYQGMIDERWSWGARAIYRKLHNEIDDMEISSNGILCNGTPGYVGYIMGNPGKKATVYTDTNCDGVNDGYVTIDTSKAGWAMYDSNGNYLGDHGWAQPKRDYKAVELVLDRSWDQRWAINVAYTLAFSKGNAEGPVNSDAKFSDTGRTENWDNPWVNYNADGYLPNDRRHQIKLRGSYGITRNWEIGATVDVVSGRPISAIGAGNPFDSTNYYSFYTCVQNCDSDDSTQRVYELRPRGSAGRTPWLFDLNANVSWKYEIKGFKTRVKLTVFNVLNQQRETQANEIFEDNIGHKNTANYGLGTGYQSPRYTQLTFNVDF